MRDTQDRVPELGYTALPRVAEVIAGMGRTEDIRFSPDNRRLAAPQNPWSDGPAE